MSQKNKRKSSPVRNSEIISAAITILEDIPATSPNSVTDLVIHDLSVEIVCGARDSLVTDQRPEKQ